MSREGASERVASLATAGSRERAFFGSAVAAVVVLAASLRLPGLAPPSLFLDDVWVALLARDASLSDLLAIKPPHPVGFLALIAIARRILPGAELSVQLLPFVASLALVPLGAWLVRRSTGSVCGGILAAVLLALNPSLSDYAIRAKPFATDALLALVLVATAERCLAEPSERRLGGLALLALLATPVSYPAALVGAVCFVVACVAAAAAGGNRGRLMSLAGAFLAADAALGFFLVRGQANQVLKSFWVGAFVPLHRPLEAVSFILSRNKLMLRSSFPEGWGLLGVLVPLGLVLLVRQRSTRSRAALFGALWASLFVAAAMRLYPLQERTTAFAYPLIALVAAGTICALLRGASRPLVREGVPALLAAAIALSSARRVSYGPVEDALLVRTLAAEAQPDDFVLVYPHANWTVGYYSGWPVRLAKVDYYGTGFEARPLRERSMTLPGFVGYEDHPEVLDPALRELVSRNPGRVLYVATHLDVNCCAAHAHIAAFLASSGYRADRLARTYAAELLSFTRRPPGPEPGVPPGLPPGGGSRPEPSS